MSRRKANAIPSCNKCGKPIAWVKSINPSNHREKWVPIDRRSWDGQTIYDKRVHVVHFRTCEAIPKREPVKRETAEERRSAALDRDYQEQLDMGDMDEYNKMNLQE